MVLQHREPPGPFEKACYVALVCSVVLVVITAVRLAMVAPTPEAVPGLTPPRIEPLGARTRPSAASALRVVAADPFHPLRTAPAERYILPEEQIAAVEPGSGPLREGLVRLLGTAVVDNAGGFVMAQVGSATPQMVRVGEVVGDLTLRSIARGSAEFTRQDGTLVTLGVPAAQSSATRETGP